MSAIASHSAITGVTDTLAVSTIPEASGSPPTANTTVRTYGYYTMICEAVTPLHVIFFFFQAEDGIRDYKVTGVQTCALPISRYLRLRFCWNSRSISRSVFSILLSISLVNSALDSPIVTDLLDHRCKLIMEIGRASCRERV